MEQYVVSARKYRPASFDTVVGQLAITQTLKNAIQTKQLAQAYLFTGPRGVGKTTCARIFAKTINCMNPKADGEACEECESCKAFNEGRSLNIHELDAASNNSVDDIRSLVEQVRIPPQIGKYSVYIIDEVHMLSTGAFNAFLKTLEEPPAYAVFILATTEKHKILPTILSRCQIYNFNRIGVKQTIEHLKYIAAKEGIAVDDNALDIIAQKADGGMRDALSIFDQVANFCQGHITYEKVIQDLNVLDYDYYFRLTELAYLGKVTESMLLVNEILSKGFDGGLLMSGLGKHIRDVLVSKDPQTVKLLEMGQELQARYVKQGADCSTDFLFEALKLLEQGEAHYKYTIEKRLCVELTIIKLCQINELKKKKLRASEFPGILPIANFGFKAVQQPARSVGAQQSAGAQASAVQQTSTQRPAQMQSQIQPQVQQQSTVKVGGTISLRDTLNKINSRVNTVPQEVQLGTSEFNAASVRTAIENFTDTKINDSQLQIVLKSLNPVVEGTKVIFSVDSNFTEQQIIPYKQRLESFIAASVNNRNLTIEINVVVNGAATSSKPVYITQADKLNHFIELNPVIAEMVDLLGLEIE